MSDLRTELFALVHPYGQEQLLAHWDRLSPDERAVLTSQMQLLLRSPLLISETLADLTQASLTWTAGWKGRLQDAPNSATIKSDKILRIMI